MPSQAELPFAVDHPLAADEISRTIALGDRIVPYILRRARRRTIGLTIDHRGLRVGAPHRAAFTEVESLIRKHADWVTQKLDEWRSRRRPESLSIVDGLHLPLLDQTLQIRLASGNNRIFWNESSDLQLTLCLRSPNDAGRILEKALREKAFEHFTVRLAHFADQLGLPPPPLALSAARTRWGSCSRKTGIRLNWRLIHFPPQIVDYVVVHELAHLREMNHSPRFWAVVGQICPEYNALRAELNRLAANCPRWQ